MRFVIILLAILLVLLQYKLWFEHDGVRKTMTLKKEVAVQAQKDRAFHQKDLKLALKVQDLRKGKESVETIAREKMGMIKSGETYFQIVDSKT